jgi:hypothetical protein
MDGFYGIYSQQNRGQRYMILAFLQKCEKSINCVCILKKTVVESWQVLKVKTIVLTQKTIRGGKNYEKDH